MKLYTLHLPRDIAADSPLAAQKLISVKDGFSWVAFVLPLPWLLFNRLWLWAVAFFAATYALDLMAKALGASGSLPMLCYIFLSLFIALEAGLLRAQGLHKRGYKHVGTYLARDREEAELKFFSGSCALQPA